MPTHGSTRYIKHWPLEIRYAARIEWGEGVSCSSNLEHRSHDGRLTPARATAAAALDDGSWRRRQGLIRVGFRAFRGTFLHVVWTYGGGTLRGTHLVAPRAAATGAVRVMASLGVQLWCQRERSPRNDRWCRAVQLAWLGFLDLTVVLAKGDATCSNAATMRGSS
jgi:hypothetical protein